jgi:hypothetical protein
MFYEVHKKNQIGNFESLVQNQIPSFHMAETNHNRMVVSFYQNKFNGNEYLLVFKCSKDIQTETGNLGYSCKKNNTVLPMLNFNYSPSGKKADQASHSYESTLKHFLIRTSN